MNIALWGLQILLAGLFLMIGSMKLFSYEKFKAQAGEHAVSKNLAAFIGASEIAGAVGLVLPWATGVLPVLTPAAAFALVLVMALAVGFHVRVKDPLAKAAPALVFLVLSLVVGLGRV
jgi:uncharacterized membrane protein YphA (DoxX/SURF4 family)